MDAAAVKSAGPTEVLGLSHSSHGGSGSNVAGRVQEHRIARFWKECRQSVNLATEPTDRELLGSPA
jgi:hypothetical protein